MDRIALAGLSSALACPPACHRTIAIGAVLAGLCWSLGPRRPLPRCRLGGGGVVYAGAALLGPALLRRDPEWGLTALLFLFATVWITDIFAYFAAARRRPSAVAGVSPNKTWSGAFGGLAGGVAAGIAVAYASGVGKLGMVGVMALCCQSWRRPATCSNPRSNGVWRQGRRPSHSRSWRRDGSSRRLPGRRFAAAL
jgi:phosphatidate cytidylyltransferase